MANLYRVLSMWDSGIAAEVYDPLAGLAHLDIQPPDREYLLNHIGEYDVFLPTLHLPIDRQIVERGAQGRLRLVYTPSTGLDHLDLEALADNNAIGLQIEIQGHPRDPLQVLQSYRGNPQEVYRLTVKKYLPADLEKRLRERLEEAGIYTTDEPAEASSVVTPTRPGGLTPADIRQARKTADWTQAELAAKVGVSQKELSLWERAKKPIPAQREKKLRGVLGDYLAGADIP